MSIKTSFCLVVFCSALFLVGYTPSVHAVTYTQTYNCSIPLTRTNWQTGSVIPPVLQNCGLTKFDSTKGNLTSVTISLAGHIESTTGIENKDSQPQTITANVSARISLLKPDTSNLVVVLPAVSATRNFPASDGITDFGGTSGETVSNLNNDQTQTSVLSAPQDIALFTGNGPNQTLSLVATAQGLSGYSASANYAGFVDTFASAMATVQYSYDAHNLALVIPPAPVMTENQNQDVILQVVNNELTPTAGATSVVLTLPIGLDFVSINNPAWSAVLNNNTLTVTTNNSLLGNSTNDIQLTLKPRIGATQSLVVNGIVNGLVPDNQPNDNQATQTFGLNRQAAIGTPNRASGRVLGAYDNRLLRTGENIDLQTLYGIAGLSIFILGTAFWSLSQKQDIEE